MVRKWRIGDYEFLYGNVEDVFNELEKNYRLCHVAKIIPFPAPDESISDMVLVQVYCEGEEVV